ncbi:MAG: hypothetical protein HOV81_19470 [Kofleriaceae bacterium]|nr:hypothetical protein [Kofleriaceae bacterium]
MRAALLVLWFGTGFVVGCGGDDGGNAAADASGDAFESTCGHPGDQGNDKGIGKFCTGLSDCSGNMDAVLCSSLGDPTTHFCTRTCPMGDSSVCGTGAECTCNDNNQCGCTPTVCL